MEINSGYVFKAAVGVAISTLLLMTLIMPVLYYLIDVRETERQISELTLSFEEKKKEVISEDGLDEEQRTESLIKSTVLFELRRAQLQELSNERTNRRYVTISGVVEWVTLLIILFLGVWNERTGNEGESIQRRLVALSIPIFTALAIAIPAITMRLGFDGRQELHDFRAQQLAFIHTELELDIVSSEQAWERFKSVYRQSPASIAEFPSLH